MANTKKLTRRDRCELLARRMTTLNDEQRGLAWASLTLSLFTMAEMDIPKFENLYRAIRLSIIGAKTAAKQVQKIQ